MPGPDGLVAYIVTVHQLSLVIAALIYRFGPPVERFIDNHFDKLVIVFSVLFVAGFVVLEFIL